jgi:hypothetical protein
MVGGFSRKEAEVELPCKVVGHNEAETFLCPRVSGSESFHPDGLRGPPPPPLWPRPQLWPRPRLPPGLPRKGTLLGHSPPQAPGMVVAAPPPRLSLFEGRHGRGGPAAVLMRTARPLMRPVRLLLRTVRLLLRPVRLLVRTVGLLMRTVRLLMHSWVCSGRLSGADADFTAAHAGLAGAGAVGQLLEGGAWLSESMFP